MKSLYDVSFIVSDYALLCLHKSPSYGPDGSASHPGGSQAGRLDDFVWNCLTLLDVWRLFVILLVFVVVVCREFT